jgi:HlyD family secretion protein
MKRTSLALLAIIATATISVGAYYARRGGTPPVLTTDAVSRGSIVSAVSATGTLQAVTTVEVGSQVSGIIESLAADFNSIVHQGEVLARLDQSTFATAVEMARASLSSAEAEAERIRVTQQSMDAALARARELSARELIPATDLQTADTQARDAAAQVVAADAKVRVARAATQTAQLNLTKTVITSPIDGVVIARNVDAGQTVSASFSAPTLFVIAADLKAMQLNANIDESDLGHVSPGQSVTFSVDAYPAETFRGTVSQVRLNPSTVNNVVTYDAIIDAPNPDLKLKPGMTATLSVEVSRRDNVLRVPAAALRYKPDAGVLEHYGVQGGGAGPNGPSRTVWVAANNTLTPVTVTPGASDGTMTELVNPPFAEGTRVVTRATSSGGGASPTSARPAGNAGNPLLPAGRFGR